MDRSEGEAEMDRPANKTPRITAWQWLLMALGTPLFLGWLMHRGEWPLTAQGTPRLVDFAMIWSAGLRVLTGEAALVYHHAAQMAFQKGLIADPAAEGLPFGYPPQALLATAPLAFLPYALAWAAFLIAGAAGWLVVLQRISGNWLTALGMVLVAGGATQTIILGQTGFVTAILMVGGLMILDRSPRLAGVAFGLLAFKPHLGIALAAALLIWRKWETIAAAVATLALLAAITTLAFGPSIWPLYLESSRALASFVAGREVAVVAKMMQSVWAMAVPRQGMEGAMYVQASAGVLALAALALVSRLTHDWRVRAAAVIAATLLCTPYLFLYDTTMLVGAIALLLARPNRRTEAALLYSAAAINALWLLVHVSFGPIPALFVLAAAILAALADRDRQRALSTAEHQ